MVIQLACRIKEGNPIFNCPDWGVSHVNRNPNLKPKTHLIGALSLSLETLKCKLKLNCLFEPGGLSQEAHKHSFLAWWRTQHVQVRKVAELHLTKF